MLPYGTPLGVFRAFGSAGAPPQTPRLSLCGRDVSGPRAPPPEGGMDSSPGLQPGVPLRRLAGRAAQTRELRNEPKHPIARPTDTADEPARRADRTPAQIGKQKENTSPLQKNGETNPNSSIHPIINDVQGNSAAVAKPVGKAADLIGRAQEPLGRPGWGKTLLARRPPRSSAGPNRRLRGFH